MGIHMRNGINYTWGGGKGYSETNLYTASGTSFIDIPLTWNWTDYDAYLFFCNDVNAQTGNPWFITQGILTDLIGTQNTLTFYPYDNAGVNYYVTATQLTAQWNSQGFYIRQIIGLNFNTGGGSASHDYSTTEHKIGTWIDGSDLYEKTYLYTGTGAANPFSTTIDTTGTRIKEIIPHYASFTYNGDQFGECIGTELTGNTFVAQYAGSVPPNLTVSSYLGNSTETYEVCFSVRYIKTT